MTFKRNLVIEAGTYFEMTLEITDEDDNPIDYSGHDIIAQFRKGIESVNSVTFDTSIDINMITLSLQANSTVDTAPGKYIYDVLVKDVADSNLVEKIVEGIVTINPTATKWPT